MLRHDAGLRRASVARAALSRWTDGPASGTEPADGADAGADAGAGEATGPGWNAEPAGGAEPPSNPRADRRLGAASPIRTLVLANALVFASSMCIMILELVAARLVAQNLGASLYTWTSVIGVILAGISVGNYIGGKVADRTEPRSVLPMLFLAASVLSFSVLWLNHVVELWARPEPLSWPVWVLLNVALVFLVPATVLGTISPVVAKMALDARLRVGTTVGNIYAWGAVGSILGTFLTGFVLIDALGTRSIVVAVALGLALIGLGLAATRPRSGAPFILVWVALMLGGGFLALSPHYVADQWGTFLMLRADDAHLDYYDESNYFAIQVYDAVEVDDAKVLALDNLVHAYVPTDDITRLIYDYESVYAAVTERVRPRRPLSSLFIGGGGFVFPRYMEASYPVERIDVAEIDPAVKEAAIAALGLPPDHQTLIRTYTMDARNFVDDRLRRNRGTEPVLYDFGYGDAFNDLSVPFHLTTREFNDKVAALLRPDGVYMINIIDIYRPGLGRFLGAYVATARLTFDHVYVFSSDAEGPTEERDTFVVVCARRPLDIHDLGERPDDPEFEGRMFAWAEGDRLGGEMEAVLERARGVILTDDYAPVDNLLTPLYTNQD